MKKIVLIIAFLSILFSFFACEYPDYEIEYSDVYPVCGEYYVNEYNSDMSIDEEQNSYILYIYNASYNDSGNDIWIDNNNLSHGTNTYDYRFKIRTQADLENLTFNVTNAPHIPDGKASVPDSITQSVTINNSKIIKNEWPIPDSIYFEFTWYDGTGAEIGTVITAGHRKTGWENVNFSDPM